MVPNEMIIKPDLNDYEGEKETSGQTWGGKYSMIRADRSIRPVCLQACVVRKLEKVEKSLSK